MHIKSNIQICLTLCPNTLLSNKSKQVIPERQR